MANELISKELAIKFGGSSIGLATSYSLECNKEVIDLSSLDEDWKRVLVDQKSWSISCDGVVFRGTSGSTQTTNAMLSSFIGTDSAVAVVIYDKTKSSNWITGNGVLTSFGISGAKGEAATYSLTIEGTGALTISAALAV